MISPDVKIKARGFTLIEMVIYIGIAIVMLLLITTLYLALVHARQKQQAIADVEGQGLAAMSLITQDIRNAQSITTPIFGGTSTTTVKFATYATSTNPTSFSVASSTLLITEGTTSPVALTNSQVFVSNISFRNLAYSGTYGSIQVQFTLTHATSTPGYSTSYMKTFDGSATVRRITQ
jgi:Tfp pilus assembly protein PilW